MAARTAEPTYSVTISRWRINAMLFVVAVVVVFIILQLGNLQVVQHEELSARAAQEIDYTRVIQPSRGVIRDRMGNVLALDVERESLFVIPGLIDPEEAPKLALTLSGLLGDPAPDILAKLENKELYWLPVKRWLEPETAEAIANLEQQGLVLQYEPRRFYPQHEYSAHVVGAVNLEGFGVSGVEAFYDTQLKGITGTITAEWDRAGNPIWIRQPEMQPANDGVDLELTLDPLVQHVVETELKAAVEKHSAASGTVIVMEPKTGAIRGMASYPTFDPNHYYKYDSDLYNINPAVSRLYEPGSTFKVVTVAAGLQSRAFDADVQVNDTGVMERYGFMLKNWNSFGHGMIDPDRVLYHSSNIGALLLNEKTGAEDFYKIVRDFGYGQPTGVDIAGEGTGIVNDHNSTGWSPIVLDTNAYGQGIAVTPLQQVRMMAAIGNDGKMMRPYIVQKRCREDVCESTQPEVVSEPIEPAVAWTVRRMMINAANSYAGQVVWGPRTGNYSDTWMVPGYEVGAKTGTSDISAGEAGYTGQIIGSVVGLAPSEDSRFAILVMIDRPQDDAYGVISAVPVFQAIAEQLLRYERITPDQDMVGPGQVIGAVTQP